jgi:hypothetical protein
MAYFIIAACFFGIGFALGRVKNATKLKAISGVIGSGGSYVSTEAQALAAHIRAHL